MIEIFSKVLTETRKQEKEVTFTIYPFEIKYRQVQFTSLGKKKLGSTVFKVITTEMKYVIPEKKVHMTVWHLPYIQDISQVRIPTKSLNFSKL